MFAVYNVTSKEYFSHFRDDTGKPCYKKQVTKIYPDYPSAVHVIDILRKIRPGRNYLIDAIHLRILSSLCTHHIQGLAFPKTPNPNCDYCKEEMAKDDYHLIYAKCQDKTPSDDDWKPSPVDIHNISADQPFDPFNEGDDL